MTQASSRRKVAVAGGLLQRHTKDFVLPLLASATWVSVNLANSSADSLLSSMAWADARLIAFWKGKNSKLRPGVWKNESASNAATSASQELGTSLSGPHAAFCTAVSDALPIVLER